MDGHAHTTAAIILHKLYYNRRARHKSMDRKSILIIEREIPKALGKSEPGSKQIANFPFLTIHGRMKSRSNVSVFYLK